MFPVKVIAILALASSIIRVVKSDNGSSKEGIPTNPCAYTLCIANTTCIAVIDPQTCVHGPTYHSCEKRAMCIPSHNNGNPGIYCGPGGNRCSIHECNLVQVYCIQAPCPPLLMCVPITPEPAFARSPRSDSTDTIKFSKFVINNDRVHHHHHQRQKGRHQPVKQSTIILNSRS